MLLETTFNWFHFHFLCFIWVLRCLDRISHAHKLSTYFMILNIKPVKERLSISFVRHKSPAHIIIFHPPNAIHSLLIKFRLRTRWDKVGKMLKFKYEIIWVRIANRMVLSRVCILIIFKVFACSYFVSLYALIAVENVDAKVLRFFFITVPDTSRRIRKLYMFTTNIAKYFRLIEFGMTWISLYNMIHSTYRLVVSIVLIRRMPHFDFGWISSTIFRRLYISAFATKCCPTLFALICWRVLSTKLIETIVAMGSCKHLWLCFCTDMSEITIKLQRAFLLSRRFFWWWSWLFLRLILIWYHLISIFSWRWWACGG
jgi:hypothetical protein